MITEDTKPKIMNVNSLSQLQKDKLKGAISELNDSMTRVDAEKELQKETLNTICTELGLDKKVVGRMAKVYYKTCFNSEVEQNRTFEEFYTGIYGSGVNG